MHRMQPAERLLYACQVAFTEPSADAHITRHERGPVGDGSEPVD